MEFSRLRGDGERKELAMAMMMMRRGLPCLAGVIESIGCVFLVLGGWGLEG